MLLIIVRIADFLIAIKSFIIIIYANTITEIDFFVILNQFQVF